MCHRGAPPRAGGVPVRAVVLRAFQRRSRAVLLVVFVGIDAGWPRWPRVDVREHLNRRTARRCRSRAATSTPSGSQARGFNPARSAIFSCRSTTASRSNFTFDALAQSQAALSRLETWRSASNASRPQRKRPGPASGGRGGPAAILESLDADLNTAGALGTCSTRSGKPTARSTRAGRREEVGSDARPAGPVRACRRSASRTAGDPRRGGRRLIRRRTEARARKEYAEADRSATCSGRAASSSRTPPRASAGSGPRARPPELAPGA